MTEPSTRAPHRRFSLAALIIMGAVYWFVAALVVRWTAVEWVGSTAATLVVFALIVVVTPAALWLGMRIARAKRAQAGYAATVMTMVALFLDGIALTWFPSLYGTDPKVLLGGAASIMFGAGAALLIGMIAEKS